MRILVHDFAGHPFQVQLSRELANAGHSVLHTYLADLPGPKGRLSHSPNDTDTFRCAGITLGTPFAKYSMLKRHWAHLKYARRLAQAIAAYRPEVVLSANTPIDVQHALLSACRRRGIAFVHWMQDLYCMALRNVLTDKFGACAGPIANYYDRLERLVCERSQAVIFITSDFQTVTLKKGFVPAKSYVIENWAPLDEVTAVPKHNSWSIRNGLANKLVFLYSGTLGLKHKPEILYDLAKALKGRPETVVTAVTEGLGRERLERMQQQSRLDNLTLMNFQPFSEISEVLGSADILIGIIDEEAGAFAVPSKVLSYLCAGRPVLLAAPKGNLAARTVERANAGITVPPHDTSGFMRAAGSLADSVQLRRDFGLNARRYSLEAFNIQIITARFEAVLSDALNQSGVPIRSRVAYPTYPTVAAD